jgi:hypothetical protein
MVQVTVSSSGRGIPPAVRDGILDLIAATAIQPKDRPDGDRLIDEHRPGSIVLGNFKGDTNRKGSYQQPFANFRAARERCVIASGLCVLLSFSINGRVTKTIPIRTTRPPRTTIQAVQNPVQLAQVLARSCQWGRRGAGWCESPAQALAQYSADRQE